MSRGGVVDRANAGFEEDREQPPSYNELLNALRSAQDLRPKLLAQWSVVPECVLEYCNMARTLVARADDLR